MSIRSKFPLGQILIEKGIITQEQLDEALVKQEETGDLLGAVLLGLGFVDEETMFLPIVAGQVGVDFVDLKKKNPSKEALAMIPAKFATHYKVIPVDYQNNTLILAMTNPSDIQTLDEVSLVVNARISPVLASEKYIVEAIRKYYGVGAETIEKMMDTVDDTSIVETIDNIEETNSEASISKFLNQMLLEAYRDRATDIHIEPFEKDLQIRYRVDGILYDAKVPSNIYHFKDAINSRIKILSNLNIAEKRMPQDGRFKVRVGRMDLDLRVSFLPTAYGESVVLRILNTAQLFQFEDLSLSDQERSILEGMVTKSHGIVFITGPTGSGKTTTLYSCLSRINTEEKKIITIEDPVEYQLKGITQIQINPSIGLSFAHGLRSMLRHDPDVMMVGEVRDIETAEISIQVALTGHLVFSTLHTNDAATGVARLIDMGVEPYLITSTVECFIAQRLIRVLCPKCKQPVKNFEEVAQEYKNYLGQGKETPVYYSKGCEDCKNTGYQGREAVYEMLLINEDISKVIMERATADQIKEKAVELGMRTLAMSGWEKVKRGVTTPEEVIRVTQEEI